VTVLTVLEERLAEAHGLAIAADMITAKVAERIADPGLRHDLRSLAADANETRARCVVLERRYDDETAAELLHRINVTKDRANDLAGAWFKAGTAPLTAWTFLAMGEAAEVTAWSTVATLAVAAEDPALCELGAWALEVQERHLGVALTGAVRLAQELDPHGARWG
jgi:hypothetical protein